MLRSLIDRPISVAIATLALVVLGAFSLLRLPVSLLPSLERPRLVVSAQAADLARAELVDQVVEPLERRLASLAGVVDVHSLVDDGRCTVALETEWQTDVDRLRIDVERRLADTASLGLDQLTVQVEAGDRAPVIELAISGGASAHDRTRFAEKVLIPELGRLEGVGRLRRLGGAHLRPVVRPHAAALAARGLTASDIALRLRDVGSSRPLGRMRDGGKVRPLVLFEPVSSLQDLAALRVGSGTGTPLGDVAQVSFEEVQLEGRFRLDGDEGVLVEVHRAPGANAVLLARQVRNLVRELEGRHRSGLSLQILRDSSREVVESLRQLALAGVLGLILGALVLRFMLGSWRPTLALAVVVPASIVAAFSGFFVWDVTLDIVSLAGLALAAGMLVDNSIVVLEAIANARSRGSEDAAVEGSEQIAMALVASFLTTAVVFVPLIYLQGLARAFFGVQAFAIVTTLAISLVLSLTLTPVLARRFGASGVGGGASTGRSPGQSIYLKALQVCLQRPGMVGVAVVAVLLAGVLALERLPRELLPIDTASTLEVKFRLPAGLDPETTSQRVQEVEQALLPLASDALHLATVYRGDDPERQQSLDETLSGTVELSYPPEAAVPSAPSMAAQAMTSVPGVHSRLRWRRSAIASALRDVSGDLHIEMLSSTPRRAEVLAERLTHHLESAGFDLAALTEAPNASLHRPALALTWDTVRLAHLGAEQERLEQQVRQSFGGQQMGRLDGARNEPEILLEATDSQELGLVPLRMPTSDSPRMLPLSAVGSVRPMILEAPLERRDGRPAVRWSVSGSGPSPVALSDALASFPLALDEEVRLRGQSWEMQRSFSQLRLALGLALLLVFLTVAALYESLTMPLVVMTTVPLAAAGAAFGLASSGQSLNIMSFLGLILLTGIVVNNAIVLLHRAEQWLANGNRPEQAIALAAEERFRPILMTTLTTMLGMLPLAALGGQGVELRRALAVAVSGGLLTSLLAALLVVPTLYLAWVRRRSDEGPDDSRRGEHG